MSPLTIVLEAALGLITTTTLVAIWGSLKKTWRLENRRDAILEDVKSTLELVREDNQYQYKVLLALIDAQELQLHALKGRKMNGEVEEAIALIHEAKTQIQERLIDRRDI